MSLRTARLYKTGERKPSLQIVRLFVLHRDRQVLPREWARWAVKSDCLVDPEGNELPRNYLRGYFLMLQWARSIAGERGLGDEYQRRLAQIRSGGAK